MVSPPARPPRIVASIAGAILVLLVGIWLGGHPSWLPSPVRSALVQEHDTKLVDEALGILSRDYYRRIDRTQLLNKGLAAAVASLGDPYSHYFNPSDYHTFLAQSNPHFGGIGVEIDRKPDPRGLRITSVFPGSPAARAGLARGEVIVQVGSVSLAKRSQEFSSNLIKGPAGTKVTLTVLTGTSRRVLTITRANVVQPVASSKLLTYHGTKVGYVQLSSFTDGSGSEVRTQVDKVLHDGARALILDLRGNGGGLLDEAVTVASIFIPDGTIVSTRGRSQPSQVYTAKGNAISTKIPLVALVDRGTASAAEIVTGALKDRGRAKVIGTHTYGKGVFQEIQTLSNGGALDITVGEYFTPSGHNLGGGGVREGAGITPDIPVAGNPRARTDQTLTVGEQTVAAEVQ